MDRIWQWAWDRYGPRYSWVLWVSSVAVVGPVYVFASFVVVAFEKSDRYAEGAAVTVVGVLILGYAFLVPGHRCLRLAQHWAAGHEVDRAKALADTYTYARRAATRVRSIRDS